MFLASKGALALLMPLLLLSAYALQAEAKLASIKASRHAEDDDDDDYAYDDDDDDDYNDTPNVNIVSGGGGGGGGGVDANYNYNIYYNPNYDANYDDDGDNRGVLGGGGSANADECEGDSSGSGSSNATTKKPTLGNFGSFGPMCVAFRTLRNVMPMQTLVRITARHYRYDVRFRHAMNFIQTVRFVRAARLIESTAAYQSMLARLEAAGVDVRELHITALVECLLLPVLAVVQQQQEPQQPPQPPQQIAPAGARSAAALMGARSLAAYTQELWAAIPHAKFRNAIGAQLSANANFARFYRAMRNAHFRRDMLHGLSSKSVRDATRTLRQNFVNLRQLLRFVFRVFSLGPRSPAVALQALPFGLPAKRRH